MHEVYRLVSCGPRVPVAWAPVRESVLAVRDEAVRCWRRTVRLVLKRHPDLIDLRLRLLHARSLDDHCPHCFQRTVQRLARRSLTTINGKP